MKGWIRLNHPKIKALRRIRSKYWLPGENFLQKIVKSVGNLAENGDVIAVSEKAISTALGLLVDEATVKPSLNAKILASLCMRIVWGFILGPACRLKPETWRRLRSYPKVEGAKHKQLALEFGGPLQALRFGSEAGIDASNLPVSYVCLPLPNPAKIAEKIHFALKAEANIDAAILIVDSDKTFSFRSLHLSPTLTGFNGIRSGGGILYYVLGRVFKLNPRSTPKALYPPDALSVEDALEAAEVAHQAMGAGAGKTVWDMAERFRVNLTGVTWSMLMKIRHYPIVILRLKR